MCSHGMYWKKEDIKIGKSVKNEVPQEELFSKMEKPIIAKS